MVSKEQLTGAPVFGADAKSFKPKLLDKNQESSCTFIRKGSYKYICSIHPKMIGKVVIE